MQKAQKLHEEALAEIKDAKNRIGHVNQFYEK